MTTPPPVPQPPPIPTQPSRVLPYAQGQRSTDGVTPRQARAGRIAIYIGGLHAALAALLGIGSCVVMSSAHGELGVVLVFGVVVLLGGVAAGLLIRGGATLSRGEQRGKASLIAGAACSFCCLMSFATVLAMPGLMGDGADYLPAVGFCLLLVGVDLFIIVESMNRTQSGAARLDAPTPLDLGAYFSGESMQQVGWLRQAAGGLGILVAVLMGTLLTWWLTLSLTPPPNRDEAHEGAPVMQAPPAPRSSGSIDRSSPADIDLRDADIIRPGYGLAIDDREKFLNQLEKGGLYTRTAAPDLESLFDEMLRDIGGHLLKTRPDLAPKLIAASRGASGLRHWVDGSMSFEYDAGRRELRVRSASGNLSVGGAYRPTSTQSVIEYANDINSPWTWQSVERAVRGAGRDNLRVTAPQFHEIVQKVRARPWNVAQSTPRAQVVAPQPSILKYEDGVISIALGSETTIVAPGGQVLKEIPSVVAAAQRRTAQQAADMARANADEAERQRQASRRLSVSPALPMIGVIAAVGLVVSAVWLTISGRHAAYRVPHWTSFVYTAGMLLMLASCSLCALTRATRPYLLVPGSMLAVAVIVTGMLTAVIAPALIAASFRRARSA